MRVSIIVPTFEPVYAKNLALEEFYRDNFDSWLDPEGDFDSVLIISDYRSSDPFKAFLRYYAEARGNKVHLLDGMESHGSFQAFNIGLRARAYDLAVWVASDTRARDRMWLQLSAEDFVDPLVLASIPTATEDGAAVLPQTQPKPIDCQSLPILAPRFFQLVSAVFSRQLLEPFGHRLCDRFHAMGNDKGIMWQILALDGKAMLNFRCNIVHSRFHEAGRHNWNDDEGRLVRQKNEQGAAKAAAAILPMPGGWLRHTKRWTTAISEGWRHSGPRGALREVYIRSRYNNFSYARNMIVRNAAHTSYVRENLAFASKLRQFRALDRRTRLNLVEALYMGDPTIYNCEEIRHGAELGVR
jgi:hypothetical protein